MLPNLEIFITTLGQFAVACIVVGTAFLLVLLGRDWYKRSFPKSLSGQTYLYSKPSDTDFFDQITEFRNDIAR